MADEGLKYNYSRQARPTVPWIKEAISLRDEVLVASQHFKKNHPLFNILLGNFYRTGEDNIGAHSDDETGHDPEAFIASVSLGAVRDFVLKDKESNKTVYTIPLAHGSTMSEKIEAFSTCQKES